jgi:hypothetical protein
MEWPECKHCGDVIGVYEPMIVVIEGQTRETSRAAEPGTGDLLGDCYHGACYLEAHGEHPDPE